jgi:hypothetical protein
MGNTISIMRIIPFILLVWGGFSSETRDLR